jgi:hypothetical protein
MPEAVVVLIINKNTRRTFFNPLNLKVVYLRYDLILFIIIQTKYLKFFHIGFNGKGSK